MQPSYVALWTNQRAVLAETQHAVPPVLCAPSDAILTSRLHVSSTCRTCAFARSRSADRGVTSGSASRPLTSVPCFWCAGGRAGAEALGWTAPVRGDRLLPRPLQGNPAWVARLRLVDGRRFGARPEWNTGCALSLELVLHVALAAEPIQKKFEWARIGQSVVICSSDN